MGDIAWKKVEELKEPFNDAINYKSKDEKQFLSSIFLRTDELKKCLEPPIYYLIGEKGTGKTAYAAYLEINDVDSARCKLTTMTETQYKRFIGLKVDGKLNYSDYANIWRSMLLLIVSQMVVEKSKSFFNSFTGKFDRVEEAIKKWNKKALNPEVESAFEALVSDTFSVKGKAKEVLEAGAEHKNQRSEKIPVIRHHLLETESTLKDAISDLKLKHDHVLFVDGIDFRPEGVKYADYIECIKGLSEAAWQLNTEFFNSIKDSAGRIKIVLLVRPDVFQKLNLYNANSRLQDNSVLLDWSTTEVDYYKSHLFEVSGKYFATQQNFKVDALIAWEQYFGGKRHAGYTFKRLLRVSFQKPRDFLTFIKYARRHQIKGKKGYESEFEEDILNRASFTKEYADYLLGEVKDYTAFYMSQLDFAVYVKFFQYLHGRAKFTFAEFTAAFVEFKKWASGEEIRNKDFLRDADSLLQFFYEVGIIGYHETVGTERDDFYHWAYRERSINNMSPKVKTSGDLILNAGIAKALDIGKQTRKNDAGGAIVAAVRRPPKRHGGKKQRSWRKFPPRSAETE